MTAKNATVWMSMNKSPSNLSTVGAAMSKSVLPILLAIGSLAQPAKAESLLLSNATVHTVSGATLTAGSVLVKDGKIEAVGAQLTAPGVKVIDLQGQHLFPGLI